MTIPAPVTVARLPPPSPVVVEAQAAFAGAAAGRCSTGELDRLSYARDMWPQALLWIRQGLIPPPPDGVVWPSTEDELRAVVALARQKRIALIPYGAGSGVCGGTWAVRGGLTLDLKRFEAIGEIDAARRCVDVGAGVLGETLERKLNARGWTLGHFPSSIYTSTVGGWLAARSAGQLSGRYGKIEDMVLSVRAVLGTGEPVVTPERPFEGPDLAALLLGSEGTLCAFTGARLRVFPVPEARAFHGFELASVDLGLEAIRLILREGLRPAVVRLSDPFDTALGAGGAASERRRSTRSGRSGRGRDWLPRALKGLTRQALRRPALANRLQTLFRRSRLVLMFEGEEHRTLAEDRAATELCTRLGAEDLGPEPGKRWLAQRYDVSYRMSPLIDAGAFADTMEVSAPWERVRAVYQGVRAATSELAFVLCHFSHAYADGCSLYFSFVGAGADEAETQARYSRLWPAALGAALSAGANVSHHHGIGLLKAAALQQALGEGTVALAALKRAFDPDGVMNPGKLGL